MRKRSLEGSRRKIIWYDLQTRKGKEFWLAGAVLVAGEKIRYPLARDQWSVHYNVSWDGRLFAGDGTEVVTVLLENHAGELEGVAAKLANTGVNLHAVYVVGLDGDLVELALVADDVKKAKKALE
jgi:hypothetical protein